MKRKRFCCKHLSEKAKFFFYNSGHPKPNLAILEAVNSCLMQSMVKAIFIALGSLFVILGLVGILTPILPTTPFLLLAAFFYARSSDRALRWLLHNRWFGAYIRNYSEGRGMALRDKIITLSLLWAAIGLSAACAVEQWWLRLLLIGIATGVTFHLARLKNYHPEHTG